MVYFSIIIVVYFSIIIYITMMKEEFKRLSTDVDVTMFQNAKEIMLNDLDVLEKTKNGFWLDIIWQKENRGIDLYSERRFIIEQLQIDDVMEFVGELQSHSHFCEVVMQPK